MDPDLSRAVTEVFVRLYDEGLIYRGKRLVNWDPVLHTARLRPRGAVAKKKTARSGTSAIRCDGRQRSRSSSPPRAPRRCSATRRWPCTRTTSATRHLRRQAGRAAADRTAPFRSSPTSYVDPAFGTGCVKITPAHDFNDYEIGQRHNLPLINIFTPDATLNDERAGSATAGSTASRRASGSSPTSRRAGLSRRSSRTSCTVPRGDRSDAVVEPLLTDQWYVKIAPLAEPAIAGRRGRPHPLRAGELVEDLLRVDAQHPGLVHQPPALVGPSHPGLVRRRRRDLRRARRSRSAHAGTRCAASDVALTQDADVLDTWFSSALWPFSTLGWPEQTPRARSSSTRRSVLVTGFDIIFFWVARMIMMGLKFMGDVPFRARLHHRPRPRRERREDVQVQGQRHRPARPHRRHRARDAGRQAHHRPHAAAPERRASRRRRASSSPTASRPTAPTRCASRSRRSPTPGRDIRFDLGRVDGYRNFCNKLWNARALRADDRRRRRSAATAVGAAELSVADRWIVSRFAATLAQVEQRAHRLSLRSSPRTALYEFTWYEFCDWYLELTKPVLQGEAATEAAEARHAPHAGRRARSPAARAASADAVHHRGDLAARGAARRAAAGRARSRADQHHADSSCWRSTRPPPITPPMRRPKPKWPGSSSSSSRCARSAARWTSRPSRKIPLLLQNARPRDAALVGKHRSYLARLAGLEIGEGARARRAAPESATRHARRAHAAGAHGRPDRPESRDRASEQAHREERIGHRQAARQARQ